MRYCGDQRQRAGRAPGPDAEALPGRRRRRSWSSIGWRTRSASPGSGCSMRAASYRKAKLDLGSFMNLPIEEGTKLEIRGSIDVAGASAAPDRGAAEDRPGRAARYRRLPTGRLAGLCRRPAGQGQRLQRRLCPLAAVYVPGQQPLRGQERHVLGAGRDRPAADLQPQPGRHPPGQDERRSIADATHRRRAAGADRHREGRPGIRDLAPAGRGARGPDHPRCPGDLDEDTTKLRRGGQHRASSNCINAQLDFNDKVKQYLDTAIRYRRSMLSLNTVVGKKIMP